jgi:hypothetical protein
MSNTFNISINGDEAIINGVRFVKSNEPVFVKKPVKKVTRDYKKELIEDAYKRQQRKKS